VGRIGLEPMTPTLSK